MVLGGAKGEFWGGPIVVKGAKASWSLEVQGAGFFI